MESKDQCKETDGDCFKFINTYLKIKAVVLHANYTMKYGKEIEYIEKEVYDVGNCKEEHIYGEIKSRGQLFLCLPVEKLKLYNNVDNLPSISIKFKI